MVFRSISLLMLATALLSGCATSKMNSAHTAQPIALDTTASSQAPASELIQQAQKQMEHAKANMMGLYAPTYLQRAEASLANALKYQQESSEESAAAHALATQQFIERGQAVQQDTKQVLSPSVGALDYLTSIHTNSELPEDYANALDDLRQLARLIEQSRTNDAIEGQPKYLAKLAELEVKTLKHVYLNPVNKEIRLAKQVDADELATTTYEQAQQHYSQLDDLIKSSPKSLGDIKRQSQSGLRAAQHAQHVAKAVKPILKLNEKKAEQHVLAVESLLARIGKALDHEDVRHLPLENQSIALAQYAEMTAKRAKAVEKQKNLQQENKVLQEKLTNALKTIEELQTQSLSGKVHLEQDEKSAELAVGNTP